MHPLYLPPMDIRYWSGKIMDCTAEEAIPALIKHYQLAQQESVNIIKIECTLTQSTEKVIITILNNYRGLFSEALQENGIVEFQCNLGKRTKHHIKIKASDSTTAYPLIFPFLIYLKRMNLIKHSQACIVKKNPEKAVKERLIMLLKYKEEGDQVSLSEIHLNRISK